MTPIKKIFSVSRFESGSVAPLYMRIKKLVCDAIEAGDLKIGDSIPSERDVALLLDVSRVTVRNAFAELVAQGILVQKPGSGTYVSGPAKRMEQALSRLTSFTQDMELRGFKTDADWLDRSIGLPTPEEALKLSVSPSEYVSRFKRLRRANNKPMAIELAVIPNKFLDNPESVKGSLYAELELRGMRPVRALQRLHAIALSVHEAKLLDLPVGSPALFIERISYLPDGRIVEFTRCHYRGDSYDFVAELSIAPESPS